MQGHHLCRSLTRSPVCCPGQGGSGPGCQTSKGPPRRSKGPLRLRECIIRRWLHCRPGLSQQIKQLQSTEIGGFYQQGESSGQSDKQAFWLRQELKESQSPFSPSLFKALNLYLSGSGLSHVSFRSFLGLIVLWAYFVGQTEPKILRLVL